MIPFQSIIGSECWSRWVDRELVIGWKYRLQWCQDQSAPRSENSGLGSLTRGGREGLMGSWWRSSEPHISFKAEEHGSTAHLIPNLAECLPGAR